MRANRFWTALFGLAFLGVSAVAQTDAGNGVGRVSFIRGEVTVQRGDSGDLTEAAINAPLVTGDRLLTGPGSRAEVQFDYGHFARLAPNAEVRMQELRPERYLIAVAEGTVSFSRVDDYDSEVEINTPSVSVRPVRRGNYRISVLPDGTTEITVRDGQAEIHSPNGVQRLGENRTMLVRGEQANPEFQMVAELRRDEFDEWNQDRDRTIRRSESYQYVDRSIPGAHELDAYGGWVNVAPYGHVWRPRVAAGWAPYRAGRWAWVDYYGWNWVSYDPWGWAPYHYGRWFHSPGNGWCWWPGGRMRHFYSPAVVGFVGFNVGGVGVGFGFGNVGWVPLAPYEPFHRWWGGGWGGWYRGGWRNNRNYIDNSVNIVNNVNITNVYRNSRVNNGMTVVNGESFRRGGSVNPLRVGSDTLRSGSVVRGHLPVAPDRGSLQYTNRTVERGRVASRLERTEGRQFYSRTTPSRVDRPNFDTQRSAMEQVQQRALGRGESANGAVSRTGDSGRAGAVERGSATAGRGDAGIDRGGALRSAESGRGAEASRSAESGRGTQAVRGAESGRATGTSPQRGSAMAQESNSERGGWRRFGEPVNRENGASSASGRGATEATRGAGDTGTTGRSATSRTAGSEGSGWRRFGEPVGRGGSDATRSSDSGRSSNTGRSSEAGRGSEAGRSADGASRGSADTGRGQSDSGWRGFGGGSTTRDAGASRESGSTESRGSDRSSRGATGSSSRVESDRGASSGRSQDAFSRGSASESRGNRNFDSTPSRGSSGGSQERVRVSPSIVRERSGGGGSDRGSGASTGRGSGSSSSGGDRGASSGRGGTNRSSVDGSSWRRFEGGAASGIQAYGEPAARSTSRQSASSGRSSAGDAFSSSRSSAGYGRIDTNRGASSSRSQDAFGGASGGYTSRSSGSSRGSYSAPSESRGSASRGSYSAPSRGGYSGSSRSSAPSYSAPSSRAPSYSAPSRGGSYSGASRGGSFGGSSGGSYSRGGGGSVRGGGGSAVRSSGGGGSSRGGGGSVSRGGGGRGGRN